MPRMTEWVVKTACTIAFRNAYRIFVADLKRREKLGDLNIDRTMILKCVLQKMSV
jgi:hypothetical protein